LESIALLILDVDGVLTDGGLPYSADGNEIMHFHVQDGGAIRLWQRMGGVVALLSGRTSPAVAARAKDLGISLVLQGVADKLPAYEELCRTVGFTDTRVCVMGDDLLDVPPMQRCGYSVAPSNALPVVKRVATYVTRQRGGAGAVAEAVERLLRLNGTWSAAMRQTGVHG
jgi:3-deoxy-D-manno-octulosonate 8-phosphate phosphatase (KDO 8-P phosphatase)